MQEMPFQRPKFQIGISNLYILLKSEFKMQEIPFQRPKFQNIYAGASTRTPLQLCRHYGLPLTKILAMPLYKMILNSDTITKMLCKCIQLEPYCKASILGLFMYFYNSL